MVCVSVIIPVYNVEKYLSDCLDRVLCQTFKDFEVICVNDGSQDNSAAILDAYAQKDKRIQIITQNNQGLSVARNNGLRASKGDYILFVDSDDCIHPDLLELTYGLAKNNQADMVSFSLKHFEKEIPAFSNHIFQSKYKISDYLFPFYKKRCSFKISVQVVTKLYKRQLIKNDSFIPNIYFEDYPFTTTLLLKHPKTVLLNEILYYYRFNPNSISNQEFSVRHIKDYHSGLNFIYERYQTAPIKEKNFIIKELFPNILKQQLNRILQCSYSDKNDLWSAFATELKDLNEKGCIRLQGNKLSRYLLYKRLIKMSC